MPTINIKEFPELHPAVALHPKMMLNSQDLETVLQSYGKKKPQPLHCLYFEGF